MLNRLPVKDERGKAFGTLSLVYTRVDQGSGEERALIKAPGIFTSLTEWSRVTTGGVRVRLAKIRTPQLISRTLSHSC